MAPTDENQSLSLAQRIRNARRYLRESQEEFGNRFGVRRGTVGEWETGTRPSKHLRQVEQFLKEQGESQGESVTYQFPLPFDQAINFECRVSPTKSANSVNFHVQIKRRA